MNASVEHLATTWASIDALCSGLSEAEWKRTTGCPGWTVQDQVAHLVDYEERALGLATPEHSPADLSHTKNELGEANEVGVDRRRSWPGAKVLDEFREVTADRLAQLRRLTDEDFRAEVVTPAGPGTVTDLLTLRVMDTWSHEQDIRRALGLPGHLDGPEVEEAIAYFTRFLPYVVGKRALAPERTCVVFEIGGLTSAIVEVVDGRGRMTRDRPVSAAVTLRIPVGTFAALVGGRSDAPGDVEIAGDEALGRTIVESLGLMP
jgi:uncharacterized protein (TIGR03083 family)